MQWEVMGSCVVVVTYSLYEAWLCTCLEIMNDDDYEINGFLPCMLSSIQFISFANLLFYSSVIFYQLPCFPAYFSLCLLSPLSDLSLSNNITIAAETVPAAAEQPQQQEQCNQQEQQQRNSRTAAAQQQCSSRAAVAAEVAAAAATTVSTSSMQRSAVTVAVSRSSSRRSRISSRIQQQNQQQQQLQSLLCQPQVHRPQLHCTKQRPFMSTVELFTSLSEYDNEFLSVSLFQRNLIIS